mgnify:CR=1 FL=1
MKMKKLMFLIRILEITKQNITEKFQMNRRFFLIM